MRGLRVHEICTYSRVNGPGVRAVVWTQGCSIGCKGCFNPMTHPSAQQGTLYDPLQLGKDLGKLHVDGITVSGGEPLDQAEHVSELVRAFREVNAGTALLFTGYTIEAIMKAPEKRHILLQFDAILAGPYIDDAEEIWKGKKLVMVTDRIPASALRPERRIEVVGSDEAVYLTGFPTKSVLGMVDQHR